MCKRGGKYKNVQNADELWNIKPVKKSSPHSVHIFISVLCVKDVIK